MCLYKIFLLNFAADFSSYATTSSSSSLFLYLLKPSQGLSLCSSVDL